VLSGDRPPPSEGEMRYIRRSRSGWGVEKRTGGVHDAMGKFPSPGKEVAEEGVTVLSGN